MSGRSVPAQASVTGSHTAGTPVPVLQQQKPPAAQSPRPQRKLPPLSSPKPSAQSSPIPSPQASSHSKSAPPKEVPQLSSKSPPLCVPKPPPQRPSKSKSKSRSKSPPLSLSNTPPGPSPKCPASSGKPLSPGGDGTGTGAARAGAPVSRSPSVVRMLEWVKGHRMFMCRFTLSGFLAMVALAVLIFVNVRKDVIYPSELSALPFLCTQAAEEIQASLNFHVDPCNDFYSFVCGGVHRGSGERNRQKGAIGSDTATMWAKIEQTLMDIPWEEERRGPENKAARLFRSCRRLVAAPTVYVKDHAESFFELVPEVSVNILLKVDTATSVLDIMSTVSLKYGVSALLFFTAGMNETLILTSVRRPLSTHFDEIDMLLVLANVAELLQFEYDDMKRAIERLQLIDCDLWRAASYAVLQQKDVLHGSFFNTACARTVFPERGSQTEYSVIGDYVGESGVRAQNHRGSQTNKSTSIRSEGQHKSFASSVDGDVIHTFLPPPKYIIHVNDLDIVRRAVRAIFVEMSSKEAVIYLLAYMLLPEELLFAFANKKDKTVCYRLLRSVFREFWGGLATRLSLAVRHTGDALFITEVILATMKDSLSRLDTDYRASVFADKVTKAQKKLTENPDVYDTDDLDSLGNMNVLSLYKNLIEMGIFRSGYKNKTSSSHMNKVSGEASTSLRIPRESLVAPLYCQGSYKFLNYATYGVSVAREVFKMLGDPFSGNGPLSGDSRGNVSSIRSCFAGAIASLSSYGPRRMADEVLLDEVVSWASAVQVAFAASETERARNSQEVVVPAMLQTLFARYCYHLCVLADDPLTADDEARWSEIKCNAAVMNVPSFAVLFNCKQGQLLFPTQHCSVL